MSVGSDNGPIVTSEPFPRVGLVDHLLGLRRTARNVLAPVLFVIALGLLCESLVRLLAIPAYILPAPSAIFATIRDSFWPLIGFAGITARSTLTGFLAGVTFGLLLGASLGASRLLYDMVYPSIIAIHAVPSVALIPLFIIWFGVGAHVSVLTAALGAFFPVTVVVSSAVASSSPELDDVLRSLGARKLDVLFKVAIPMALPQFFASIKLAITAAFIGTVVAEIYAGSPGIGRVMIIASNDLNGPLAFSGLTLLACMGATLYVVSSFFEGRMTAWAYRR